MLWRVFETKLSPYVRSGMMIDVVILFIVFRPMVCILNPLRFIAQMALCAFAMRFCMCAYVFGVPGWIWAPR